MAISAPHFYCFRELHRRGELPQGGALLEIGEANWYGDLSLDVISQDIHASGRDELKKPFHDCWEWSDDKQAWKGKWSSHDVVKVIYNLYLNSKNTDAIDYHGTSICERRDLNTQLVAKGNNYETVINHGTAEHIFNVANVFRLMHDQCKPCGLMIHESPFTGWIEHGFWNINPTVYFDLAHANAYDIRFMAVNQIEQQSSVEIHSREHLLKMAAAGGIPNNSMLYVAMRKAKDEAFKIPMQGVYAGSVSADVTKAWKELR